MFGFRQRHFLIRRYDDPDDFDCHSSRQLCKGAERFPVFRYANEEKF